MAAGIYFVPGLGQAALLATIAVGGAYAAWRIGAKSELCRLVVNHQDQTQKQREVHIQDINQKRKRRSVEEKISWRRKTAW